jgi:hypothetical protein
LGGVASLHAIDKKTYPFGAIILKIGIDSSRSWQKRCRRAALSLSYQSDAALPFVVSLISILRHLTYELKTQGAITGNIRKVGTASCGS